ncbi:hypothetical protein SLEP1_g4351 [Rubroshorea leprosula]|uniref:Serine/threonine-protein kinase PRP4 homolog n=1 Tax=Rubroshorea leprosula TaxID=152421 RepID=A0AAV5HXA5_9ROSI|nr:hypothetical protein SLEP1_g4351 [Rubroshorea leprosula]
MASDTQDLHRRKHRRSPSDDEESEKSSKRHKHRHHRHRHHRHRSKKNADGVDEIAPSPPSHALDKNSSRNDDDVEEGEILDEESIGDIKAGESGDQCGGSNPGIIKYIHRVGDLVVKSDEKSTDKNFDSIGLRRISSPEPQEQSFSKAGSVGHINENRGRESGSPPKKSVKKKSYLEDMEEADGSPLNDSRKLLSSDSSGGKYKASANSPLDERYHDCTRGRSRSSDHARDRSRSRSIMDEESLLKRQRRHEQDGDASLNQRHRSGDLVRDEERGHSVSYSRAKSREREIDRDLKKEKEHDWRRDREMMDREWRREKDRERSRDREMDRERRREKGGERSRDKERERERRRDKERERSRDREMDKERRKDREGESSRERDRERSKVGLMDSERRREKERGRSRDRDIDSERRREEIRERSQDREVTRGGRREKERDRSGDRVRVSVRDGDRIREIDGQWNWERDRERKNDRSKDKGMNIEIENDSCGDLDRYKNSKHSRRDETESYWDRTRKIDQANAHGPCSDSLEGDGDKLRRDKDEHEDFEEKITLKLAEQEEEELNRIREESRKRRQAILEKYKNQQLQQQNESCLEDTKKDIEPTEGHSQFLSATDTGTSVVDDGHDRGADVYVADPLLSVGKSPTQNGKAAAEKTGAAGLGEGTPKSKGSDEKFCDDIFGETPARVQKSVKGEGLPIIRSGLHDNWDDAEGYYSYRVGEILDGRYEVTAAHGKGVFSTVVRAKDLKAGSGDVDEVAIKIIRNNETMHKAGQLEVQILKKLAGADPENKRHCVRFLSSFKYRNHLCLVFESLHMNLREVLKKFGRNIGLKLTAVRAYAKQLFIALKHLKNCGVLHCDIKPDNMLVNEAKNVLKLCDFGNAMFAGKNEITPYLVSRFYRAPEIILGLPYDHPMDMWSVGCCLYELYTGKVLFPGATNNDMLRLHMELKGPFPKKMLRKGAFTDQHFDQDLNFHATEEDTVTKKTITRMILNIKPKDIGSIILGYPGEDPKMLANFKDLLEKNFVLDPEKRLTVHQALNHPFITGK